VASAAILLDNPLLLEWNNAAAVFYDPTHAHIGLMLLTYQLGYFDILPLYVVLMSAAPLIVIIHRTVPNFLLPISLGIYLFALITKSSLPSWPTEGQWFFNPLAWQFIFVLGFLMARERGVGGFVRRNISRIRLVAAPVLLIFTLCSIYNWWPDPTRMPEPRLLFIHSKTYATPLRIAQFLALVALGSALFPFIYSKLPRFVRFSAMLGRNSLHVFCIASLLSLGGQIIRYIYKGDFVVDTLIVVVGIAVLALTAWLAEKRERREKRS